jgi:hypothetical protein
VPAAFPISFEASIGVSVKETRSEIMIANVAGAEVVPELPGIPAMKATGRR